ncbi:MAG: hypothetical protein JNL97_09260 [Verrucomicrobiales bacterium]|nr:hypothetical protein [Verrucomicrobiales bacterium]
MARFASTLLCLALTTLVVRSSSSSGAGLVHFEARQTHPLERSKDGSRLLALDSVRGRVVVFDIRGVAQGGRPIRIAEIPTGLEPVSVRARTEDEAWVVNELSDSVSVISLSRGCVVATLTCPDEPGDVVFSGGQAFVACSRNGLLRVIDADTREESKAVPFLGGYPHTLAAHPDGSRVFVGFLHSGNGTTLLPASAAPDPDAPWNPALPPAPRTGRIVAADDPRIAFRVLDRDVAEVSTRDPSEVVYRQGLGSSILSLAVSPDGSDLWVGAIDADNRIRYEPRLKGRFARNVLARYRGVAGQTDIVDLSPFDAEGRSTGDFGRDGALAQPMSVAVSSDGAWVWVAAFGSDRVARVSTRDGGVRDRVDLRSAGEGSRRMRGPRGLVIDPATDRVFVLNKLSETLSVIDAESARLLDEVPLGIAGVERDPALEGRGILFDARLSGNGATSCSTCHLDADVDGLAWDLGDPAGEMTSVPGANLAVHDTNVVPRAMHPMKGPMLTQTLRGLERGRRLHWRGDRADLHTFNPTFRELLGGSLVSDEDIDRLGDYLATLRHHPNPNRSPDDSLPMDLRGGNAVRGQALFAAHLNHCGVCHVLPRGSNDNIDDPRNLRLSQPLLTPALRTTYQRAVLDVRPGATNVSGFGLLHDGSGGFRSLPTVHFYDLDALSGQGFKDVEAFVMSFDSGTPPVVGYSLTLDAETARRSESLAVLDLLETQAGRPGICDLVVHGRVSGRETRWLWNPADAAYLQDSAVLPASRSQMLSALGEGDLLTFVAVTIGSGARRAFDRNGNGLPDGDEPRPELAILREDGNWRVVWPSAHEDWYLESSPAERVEWVPDTAAVVRSGSFWARPTGDSTGSSRLYRLRRSW